MKRLFLVFGSICIFCILQISCVSSAQKAFEKVYTGETEELISNKSWLLQDLNTLDKFTFGVVFSADGTVSWYNLPDSYNGPFSEKSTWERIGDDVIFNANRNVYLYEGKLSTVDGKLSITGQYKRRSKTGYVSASSAYKISQIGDFIMTEQ